MSLPEDTENLPPVSVVKRCWPASCLQWVPSSVDSMNFAKDEIVVWPLLSGLLFKQPLRAIKGTPQSVPKGGCPQ